MANGDSEVSRLVDQLEREHSGEPWHGQPLGDILSGITHQQAAVRPLPGGHTIWEIVLHIIAWAEIVQSPKRRSARRVESQGFARAVPCRTTVAHLNVRMFVRPPKRRRRRRVESGTGFPRDPRLRALFAPRTSARLGMERAFTAFARTGVASVRRSYARGKKSKWW